MNEQTISDRPLRVCVVGSGTRFLSGISYYTNKLTNVLAQYNQTSVILMRQLLPTVFYPGRARVGTALSKMQYAPDVSVYDGVDWYWLPSITGALAFLWRERPDVIVFQWWSGTVLHSYLVLAVAARLLGAKIVIEFHEVLDTAEANIPVAQLYARFVAAGVVGLSDGFVIHSEFDRPHLEQRYSLGDRPIAVIPHGPYDQYQTSSLPQFSQQNDVCNVLFFGTIRPYKGLEDLLKAFESLSEAEASQFHLTVVGETWEGWTLPAELIAQSRYKERITFVNRYVPDEEVGKFFSAADVVALPYHRSSASGPLHIAMNYGLPTIVTKVGGLWEAAHAYKGALFVAPENPVELKTALLQARTLQGQKFSDPHSWIRTAALFDALFANLKLKNKLFAKEVVA